MTDLEVGFICTCQGYQQSRKQQMFRGFGYIKCPIQNDASPSFLIST